MHIQYVAGIDKECTQHKNDTVTRERSLVNFIVGLKHNWLKSLFQVQDWINPLVRPWGKTEDCGALTSPALNTP